MVACIVRSGNPDGRTRTRPRLKTKYIAAFCNHKNRYYQYRAEWIWPCWKHHWNIQNWSCFSMGEISVSSSSKQSRLVFRKEYYGVIWRSNLVEVEWTDYVDRIGMETMKEKATTTLLPPSVAGWLCDGKWERNENEDFSWRQFFLSCAEDWLDSQTESDRWTEIDFFRTLLVKMLSFLL